MCGIFARVGGAFGRHAVSASVHRPLGIKVMKIDNAPQIVGLRFHPFIGLLAITIAGCAKSDTAAPQLPTPKVVVVAVGEFKTTDHDEYVGRLEAPETVAVRSRVQGFIKSVDFQDGDMVEAGQILYTIEPDEYQAIHQQSLSRIAVWESKQLLAKSKLTRTQGLIKSGAATAEELDEALAAEREAAASIVSAKADAERSALDLKYTQIHAPISGRVGRTMLTPGNLVSGGLGSGTPLTEIVKIDPIYVNFDVDERALLRYQSMKKQSNGENTPLRERAVPCYVQLADETDFPHQGVLDFIENSLNPTTGTIRIRGVLNNTDRRLAPGMFVRVQIPVSDEYMSIMIPEEAISSDQDVKYAYVVDGDGVVVRRNLQLGARRDARRIVREGLAVGERLIVAGQQRVRPGQKVDVTVKEAETQDKSDAAAGKQ